MSGNRSQDSKDDKKSTVTTSSISADENKETKKEFKSSDELQAAIREVESSIEKAIMEASRYENFYRSLCTVHPKSLRLANYKKKWETAEKYHAEFKSQTNSLNIAADSKEGTNEASIKSILQRISFLRNEFYQEMGIIKAPSKQNPSASLLIKVLSQNNTATTFFSFLGEREIQVLGTLSMFGYQKTKELEYKSAYLWDQISSLLQPRCWMRSLGEDNIEESIKKLQKDIISRLKQNHIIIHPSHLLNRFDLLVRVGCSQDALTEEMCIALGQNDKAIIKLIEDNIDRLDKPIERQGFTLAHCLLVNGKIRLLENEVKRLISLKFFSSLLKKKTTLDIDIGEVNIESYVLLSGDDFIKDYKDRHFFDLDDEHVYKFTLICGNTSQGTSKFNPISKWAIQSGDLNVVKWYCEKNKDTKNFLKYMKELGQYGDPEIVNYLLKGKFLKPADFAKSEFSLGAAINDKYAVEMLRLANKLGCAIDSQTLFDAAAYGKSETIHHLNDEFKLSLDVKNNRQANLSHFSVSGGNISTLQLVSELFDIRYDALNKFFCFDSNSPDIVFILQLLGVSGLHKISNKRGSHFMDKFMNKLNELIQAYPENQISYSELESKESLAAQVFQLLKSFSDTETKDKKNVSSAKALVEEFKDFKGTTADLFYMLNYRLIDYMLKNKTPINAPLVIAMRHASNLVLRHVQKKLEARTEQKISMRSNQS